MGAAPERHGLKLHPLVDGRGEKFLGEKNIFEFEVAFFSAFFNIFGCFYECNFVPSGFVAISMLVRCWYDAGEEIEKKNEWYTDGF